ncbi:hypothetical protein [Candidatus Bathycorpusculum sp.]|uniref:hypothetical protein n=1 Tax=Candidatus Bathycorpusculum sp. TaxID=2994959 RepID=UPI002835C6D9|nr:hypothetical protein [Candidatus Termitimicrobium sp.]MCL2685801.1 hypothetical protein [Candidatus Termitimicrobium sp.]
MAESNPDIILKVVSGTNYGVGPLKAQRDDVLGRSLLSETNAVKNQKVYTYYNIITQGIRYPIGLLYCEKWLYLICSQTSTQPLCKLNSIRNSLA